MNKDMSSDVMRMVVAGAMADEFNANPPDKSVWIDGLEGCAKLFELAAQHLDGDPDYAEAMRCIRPAVELGADVFESLHLSYALSGQAADDMFEQMRLGLESQ